MRTFWIAILMMALQFAHAEDSGGVYIKVGDARLRKSLVALTAPKFIGASQSDNVRKAGLDVYKVLKNDLDISGYFKFIEPQAYLEDPAKINPKPYPDDPNGFRYSNWASIGVDFLILSNFSIIGSNLNVATTMFHIPTQKQTFQKSYVGPLIGVRAVAHTIAADILGALTGTRGMFGSQLVYSRSNGKPGVKEVFVADWDLFNELQITFNDHLSISPSWSPNGEKIAYTHYTRRKSGKRDPDLYVYDLKLKKRLLLSQRPGTESGSMWLPDGEHILLTHSQGGHPDIFKINLAGEIVKRLTQGPHGAMNVEPSIPKDGSKIVFSSDRLGQPHLYVMNPDGSGQIARTRPPLGKYNSSPTFSPDGSKIVFASHLSTHFDLYIMNSDGTGLKKLVDSNGSSNEDPTFSPDGRHIIFVSNRTGRRQLYITNVEGTDERRLSNDNFDYYKPKWSIHH